MPGGCALNNLQYISVIKQTIECCDDKQEYGVKVERSCLESNEDI